MLYTYTSFLLSDSFVRIFFDHPYNTLIVTAHNLYTGKVALPKIRNEIDVLTFISVCAVVTHLICACKLFGKCLPESKDQH